MLPTLLYRTYNICSSYFQIHEEINRLKSVWWKNSSPFFFIGNFIHKFLNILFIKRIQNFTTTQKKEVTKSLEYLRKMLLAKKQLTNIFRSCLKNIKLNMVFGISNWLYNVFRFKNQLPESTIRKNCLDISAAFAIMSTLAKPNAIDRQYEHFGKSTATDKPVRYSDKDVTICH